MSKIIEQYKEYVQSTKALLNEKFSEALLEIRKDYPGLNTILHIGYTPGFNDGEPCYHTSETLVTEHSARNWGFENEVIDNNLDQKTADLLEDELHEFINAWAEQTYGTDYKITITFSEDGWVQIDREYYECGY